MGFIVVGAGVGVVGAMLMTRTLAHLLTQRSPSDPVSFVAAVAVLASAAIAGAYLPARRAMRIDPAIALRRDV
jgi:ABC-type antimicrobial peptide transport system permease subunit